MDAKTKNEGVEGIILRWSLHVRRRHWPREIWSTWLTRIAIAHSRVDHPCNHAGHVECLRRRKGCAVYFDVLVVSCSKHWHLCTPRAPTESENKHHDVNTIRTLSTKMPNDNSTKQLIHGMICIIVRNDIQILKAAHSFRNTRVPCPPLVKPSDDQVNQSESG